MASADIDSDATDRTLGDGASTTATTLIGKHINVMVDLESTGNAYFDVYGTIGADSTITACTLSWYNVGFTKEGIKPPTSSLYTVRIYTGSAWYEIEAGTYPGDGADSVILDATERGYIGEGINPSGGPSADDYDTHIEFNVPDPGANRSRTWSVAAYEHASPQPRLAVTYTEAAAGGTTRTVILSC